MWLTYYLGLNLAQELWQYIKNYTIKHKVYEIIEDLQDRICKFIRNILNLEII